MFKYLCLEITTENGSMRGKLMESISVGVNDMGTLKKDTGSSAHKISSIIRGTVAVEESGVKDAWESHLPSHLHGADCW